MNNQKRRQILERLRDDNPHPTTELNFKTPFELLIAVLLSAQATDVSVNKATDKLYPVANTPQAMLELGVDGVKEYIKTIGLFNTKAENVIKTCAILLERHGGEVPENREALEALPGVGRKTANVVLNTAFGWPTIAVDTHIFRVSNRTGFAVGKNVDQVEEKPLHLSGSQTALRFLYHRGLVRVQGKGLPGELNTAAGSQTAQPWRRFWRARA